MSKLYQKYMSLKMQDSKQLYLFKSGIFFIFIDEDAKLMSSILNLKLTNLNSIILKCGFPVSQLDKYSRLITSANYSFKIIDSADNISYSPTQYHLNDKVFSILNKISLINSNYLSISSAYDFIDEISKECKLLLGDYMNNGKKSK